MKNIGDIPYKLNINDKYELSKKNDIKEDNFNENRISFKLSLRKKKLKEMVYENRKNFYLSHQVQDFDLNNINKFHDNSDCNNTDKFLCKDEYILSGKLYDKLNDSYKSKNELSLRNMLNGLGCFINDKRKNHLEFKDILLKANSSYNIRNNIKNEYFPLGHLLLNILFQANDKIVYIYCLNFLLYFSSVFDIFCKEISNERNVNNIFQKLIDFYPFITENKKTEKIYEILNINNDMKPEVAEAYKYGSQTLQLLGNIFISSKSYKCFESINFYEKVFYLLIVFDLEYEHKSNIKYRIDYLDTLLWLIFLILKNVENIDINYKDLICKIIPLILNNINILSSSEEFYIIEALIDLVEYISEINNIFCQKIFESNGINILTNKIEYLFKNHHINDEDKSKDDILDNILNIIINIFLLDSCYLKYFDYSQFIKTFENLFNYFKVNHSQENMIEKQLVHLLSVLACFDDIQQIINGILLNKNIISNLFKVYYEKDESMTLLFIDNIMIKQKREVRNFILDMGAFDILKNHIFNYNEKNIKMVKSSINILFKIIKAEKGINDKSFLEKINNTSIPDKIKELYSNNIIPNDIISKFIIEELDNQDKNI